MLGTNEQIGLHLLDALKGISSDFPLVPHGNLRHAIAKAKMAPESRSFATLVGAAVDLQHLLFLHWSHTSLLNEISIPVLFSTPPGVSSSRTITREAKKGAEIGGFTIERILNESKPQLEDYMKRLVKRLEASGITPETMNQAQLLAAIFEAMGLITAGSPLSALLKLAQPLEDYFADEAPDLALTMLSMTKSSLLEYGLARRAIAIHASWLDESRYESAISQLVDEGFLRPALTLYWGDGHPHVPTSYYLAGHERIPRVHCEVCKKTMRHGTFLLFRPPAMTFVRHREGGVLHFLAWKLENSGISWNGQAYADGLPDAGEPDLIYESPGGTGTVLIESKSFVTDTPERTVQSNLKDAAKQLAKKVDVLSRGGVTLSAAAVATNYIVTDSRRKTVAAAFLAKRAPNAAKIEVRLLGPGHLFELPGLPSEQASQ